MNCRELESNLAHLLADELPPATRAAAERHAAGCAACRELWSLAAAPLAAEHVDPPPELLSGVLRATSAAPCERALEQLAASRFQPLAGLDLELVEMHLGGCPSCRALAGAMEQLERDLPRLAELRPPPELLPRVLRATLPLAVLWRRWWQRQWPRLLQRPRFAMEAAFALTLLFVPVLSPGAPLDGLPGRVLSAEWPRPPLPPLEAVIPAAEERLAAAVSRARGSSFALRVAGLAAQARALADDAERWSERIVDDIGTIVEAAASLFREIDNDGSAETSTPTTDQEPSR